MVGGVTHSLSNHSLLTHYSLTTHSLGGLGVAGSPGVEPTTPSIRARFWYRFTGSRTYDPLDPGSILVPLYRRSNPNHVEEMCLRRVRESRKGYAPGECMGEEWESVASVRRGLEL